ncbi:hypothetical protein B0H34DRAFT_804316 [Crassisporium funariophilum]|nr:hypothetical protein B0H34DRAFT_804316 [Crassisporium funariophilum]
MTASTNQPFSSLSRQIDQCLWVSVILSCAAAAVSLVNLGRLSLLMCPIMFLITIIHNLTLIGLAARDRKKSPDDLQGSLAATSSKGNIIFLWILAALWIITVLIVIVVSVLVASNGAMEGYERLAGYVELPFQVAEIGILIFIALKCTVQRRRTIVLPANIEDWQQFANHEA